MYKNIKITLAVITACLLQSIQANNYVWIHGLTDDETCWTVYQQAFTPSNGIRVGYSSEQSIAQAATKTWNNTNEQLFDSDKKALPYHKGDTDYLLSNKNDMILIGHSMGGLVSRDLQYQYGNLVGSNNAPRIKGIITLGTPNEGAKVENSLTEGPLKSLIMTLTTKTLISITATVACFGSEVGKTLIKTIAPTLTSGIKASVIEVAAFYGVSCFFANTNTGYKQCDQDMKVGSPYMNTIASRKVTVPILCFAAEEDRWQLFRLGSCVVNGKDLRKDANCNSNGKIDNSGYAIAQASLFVTYGFTAWHTGMAIYLFAAGWTNPYNFYLSGLNGIAAASWYNTGTYLNSGLDFDHANIVGATHVETIAENHRFLWRKWTTYTNITVPEPHDGVVPVKSQYMATNKGTNVIIPGQTIKGVNHVEEFNHPNTRIEIDNVLNGRSYGRDIFAK